MKTEPTNDAEAVASSELKRHVWLVVGETGEYSDHRSWIVRGYRTEEEAVAHKDACQAASDYLKRKYPGRSQEAEREGNPHDIQFYCDYNGTDYSVEMVEVGAWADGAKDADLD